MKTLNKTLVAVTLAAGLASTNAMAAATFNDFTVDNSDYESIGGPLFGPKTFTADKITGNYVEVATFDIVNGTFDISIQWEASAFVADDGIDSLTALDTGLGADYGLYALFQASGTFTVTGAETNFIFNPGGSLDLFVDDDVDTEFTAPGDGATAWVTGNNSDDVLIATGVAVSGFGNLDPLLDTCENDLNPDGEGINCGSFGSTQTFALTAEGKDFFIAPIPFYNLQLDSGQLNNFEVSGTQTINGSFDVVFKNNVPEPSSIALMGLGFIGLGFAGRKKAK